LLLILGPQKTGDIRDGGDSPNLNIVLKIVSSNVCQKAAFVVTFQIRSKMILANVRLVNGNFLRIVLLLRPI
jgi:hypothetical protein